MITPEKMKDVLETDDAADYQIIDIQPEADYENFSGVIFCQSISASARSFFPSLLEQPVNTMANIAKVMLLTQPLCGKNEVKVKL
jgi:hypothetical protein